MFECVVTEACEPAWTKHDNTMLMNGADNSADTLAVCQSSCVDNVRCTGVDWNPNNSPGQRCYLHGSWSFGRNNGGATGVTHYDLTRCGKVSLSVLAAIFQVWNWVSRCLLKQRMMEVAVTIEAVRRAKLQSNHNHQQINILFFAGRSPSQQCQSTEGKNVTSNLLTQKTHLGLFQLCLRPLIDPGYLGEVWQQKWRRSDGSHPLRPQHMR